MGKAKLALREVNDKYYIKKKTKLLDESKKKMLLETGIGRHVGQNTKSIGNSWKNRKLDFIKLKTF